MFRRAASSRRRALLMVAAAATAVACAEFLSELQDIAAPVLTAFGFTPDTVDITTASGVVDVQIGSRDDTGVSSAVARLVAPSGAPLECTATTPTAGTITDGTWTCSATIAQGSELGTWSVDSLRLIDALGNEAALGLPDLVQAGYTTTFEVIVLGPVADLAVTKTATPGPVLVGDAISYTITVTNLGPSDATAVVLVDSLPLSVTLGSTTPGQGTCGVAGQEVNCDLGAIAFGATVVTTIAVTTAAAGTLVNEAFVSGAEVDSDPSNSSAMATTLVLAPNRAPVANPAGPYTGTEGTAVAFDGTGSSDPDADPLTFDWTFGDPNTAGGGTATGAQPTHTYADNSGVTPFDVTLIVSDTSLSDAAQSTVTVANVAPAVTLTGPAASITGTAVTFDVSFSDPGVLDAPWAYTIDWGDGTTADAGNRTDQTAFSVNHTFATAGTFDVVTTVTDKDGGAGADMLTITVAAAAADLAVTKTAAPDPVFVDSTLTYTVTVTNLGPSDATSVVVIDSLPPSVAFGSATPTQGTCGVTGQEVRCDLGGIAVSATVTMTIVVTPTAAGSAINRAFVSGAEADPDPTNDTAADTTLVIVPNRAPVANADGPYVGLEGTAVTFDGTGSSDPDSDPLTFDWNFGDPNTAGGGTASGGQPTYMYADNSGASPFDVTLIVSDTSLSDNAQSTATIANVAPTVTLTGPAAGKIGVAITADVSFTDPGVLDAPWAFTIDWGDGTPVDAGNRADQTAFSANHAFGAAGTFEVVATVTDKDGGAGADTISIVVAPPAAADVAVVVQATPDPVAAGATLTNSVTVANLGPDDVTDVNVQLVIEGDVQLVTTPAQCTPTLIPSPPSAVFDCTVANLPAGSGQVLDVDVAPQTPGATIVSTATIISWTGPADPDPTNNTSVDTTQVEAAGGIPLTGRVVYSNDVAGNRNLWVKDLETSVTTQLTSELFPENTPAWSPSGTRIAFEAVEDVWVMNADGTGVMRLTVSPGNATSARPTWSPDGNFIAYQHRSDIPDDWDIRVVEVGNPANIVELTNNTAEDFFPDWSPDGTRIVVSRDQTQLVTFDAADGANETIVLNAGCARDPDWSPDGTQIATSCGEIAVVTVATGATQLLTSNGNNSDHPSWSPDGQLIMYHRTRVDGRDTDLWVVRADGSATEDVETGFGNDLWPDWTASAAGNLPPVSDPNGPYVGTEGSPVTFDGTGSSDPDNDPLFFVWNFGDPNTAGGGGASTVQPMYTYSDNSGGAPFGVSLLVSDGLVNTTAFSTATITNVAPVVTLTETSPGPNALVSVSFVDPGALDAPWDYTIDWGDGTGVDVGSRNNQTPFTVGHTYAGSGTFDVVATVTDKDGDTGGDSISVVVTVADLGVALVAAPDPVAPTATLTHTMTLSNAGPGDVTDVEVQLVVEGDVQIVTTPAVCNSFTIPAPGAVFECTIPSLAAGASQPLILEVAPQTAGETIVSTATIISWVGPGDPDLTNNTAADTTQVEAGGAALDGRLLFVSTRAGNTKVFVKDLPTGVVTQLTSGGASVAEGDPDWSPDGTRIAFWRNSGGGANLWLMNDDGTGQTQITFGSTVQTVPRWSPDGTELAYQQGSGMGDDTEILVINVSTLQTRTLTNNAVNDAGPTWSADGTRIAFTRSNAEVVAVDAADGANEAILYTGSSLVLTPRWSPDGTQIVFAEGAIGTGPVQLKILTLATSNVVQITAETGTGTSWIPAWSPDGQMIAFTRQESFGTGVSNIWVIGVDGSGLQEVEASAFTDQSPSWAPAP